MDRPAILVLSVFAAFTILAADPADLDRDGLNDAFEQALLERFRPAFMLSAADPYIALMYSETCASMSSVTSFAIRVCKNTFSAAKPALLRMKYDSWSM